MKPDNSIDPFNTAAWMQEYPALLEQQRARQQSDSMPAGQAGFEQQLSELQLNSSDESSAEASPPDTRPVAAHGTIRRTEIGGSMQMPPQSSLRDNRFSSACYSADLPHAPLGGSTGGASQSDLHDSSADYISISPPEAWPTMQTKDGKNRGLWSRIKSGVGKAFGGSRSENSSGGWTSIVVHSELRMDFAKRSRASDEDEQLISGFRNTALQVRYNNYANTTVNDLVSVLRRFSAWLQHPDKNLTLASLLHAPDQLNALANEFAEARGNNRVHSALTALQDVRAGNMLRQPSQEDERLISEFIGRASGKYAAPTVKDLAGILRSFSRWLQLQPRNLTLASLLEDPDQLNARADEFVEGGGNKRVHRTLTALDVCTGKVIGRRPYPEDENLFKQFAEAGRRHVLPATIDRNLAFLSELARWLRGNNRSSLVSRYQDPSQADSLAKDILEYRSEGGDPHDRLQSALFNLRRLGPEGKEFATIGPGPDVMGRRLLDPHSVDARLIDGLFNQSLRNLGPGATREQKGPLHRLASRQRRFSEWLQREGKGSLASRLNSNQKKLTNDLQEFRKAIGQEKFSVSFDRLRKYLQVVEANAALGLSPERASGREPAGSQTDSYDQQQLWRDAAQAGGQGPVGWTGPWLGPSSESDQPAGSGSTWSPQIPSDFDPSMWPGPEGAPARSSEIYRGLGSIADLPFTPQDVRDDAHYAPPARSEPARSSEIYRGLGSIADLPSTPLEMRDDAQSRPVLSPAGRPPFFIAPSGMPQELEDIGYLVGEDWQHGSQPVPDLLLDVLDNKMLLPSSRMAPQPVSINGETYSIALGPRGSRDAQLIHHPGPSSVPDARIGASTASASAGDRSGRVLGTTEWLGDEHIARDYELLAQELHGNNPHLAARARLVDPLVATQLRLGDASDALRAFQHIVYNQNGNDTADFLFMPVNDAGTDPHLRGSHWSLLFVDRRNRESPVAYHYDSASGYNDEPAALLAARLGVPLERAGMARQRNGYDCGVYVVDGTRELVNQLVQGQQPDLLNLDELVVDRQALQNRLGG
ncbi:Ulp1 family isopeptidase [Bradyrhizobium sp. ma5]|uniref:Ulp1 family isopeptidase n=1 Tax=Bradyrhizobium sp. ma5 TaxID=3344828 RepID=UPI0035D4FD38